MRIYLTTQGARIIREGSHLLVRKGNDTYHTLFAAKLSQVIICGRVELTPAALQLLLRQGVDTVFLTRDGRYLGRLATPESKNVFLRKKQFALLDDREFALGFCRRVLYGKLTSQAVLLMRISRTRRAKDARARANEIRNLIKRLEGADTIDQLRGLEGRAGALYFQGLQRGLLQSFGFCRRVRRPPTDPVNAVLSLLYTFLFNRVYSAIRQANLDPYAGFLHTPDYGRFSLVMDLMEEFRTIIADTLTLSLFNLKVLQQEDFSIEQPEPETSMPVPDAESVDVVRDKYGLMTETSENRVFDLPPQRMDNDILEKEEEDNRGKPAVKLTPQAFKRVVENFERKLTTEIHHPVEDRKMTYNDAIVAQAHLFRQVLEGTRKVYEPLILK